MTLGAWRSFHNLRMQVALAVGVLTLLAHSLILTNLWLPIQAIAALVWAGLVPGALAVYFLLADDPELDVVERGVLSVGLGYVSLALGTLLLQAIPGPLTRRQLLLFYDGLICALLIAVIWRGPQSIESRPIRRERGTALLAILLLAAAFRLPFLGHSDFRGDEARALIRAAEMLQGNDEVLLLHKKGPVEILIPAFCYAISGRINEWVARFPFAWAGVTTVLALALLGRRLFNQRVGWLAGVLLAINGYFVGLARITQYQSVVFLSTVLALFCYYRFYETDKDRPLYLLLGTALAVLGLLSHYEAFFALPVMAYLLWARARRTRRSMVVAVRWALPSLLLGLVILGSFYLSFFLHPHFERTSAYLSQRTGGQLLYNNLKDLFLRASEYCGTYYLLSFILALTAAMVIQLSFVLGAKSLVLSKAVVNPRLRTMDCGLWTNYPWRWLLPLLALLGLTGIAFFPSLWRMGAMDLAAVVFLIPAGLLLLAPRISDQRRLVALWFAVPALFYFFLLAKVQTHYAMLFPAWTLIVALVLDGAWRWMRRPSVSRRAWCSALAVGGIFYGLCSYYIYLAFVQRQPEYIATYPQHKSPLFWMPFGDTAPSGGHFGFSHQLGWKAIGALYAQGVLKGEYDSVGNKHVMHWYTRGQIGCPEADNFIVARGVFPHRIPSALINGEYSPAIQVWIGGEPKLWVWQRGYEGSIRDYRPADLGAYFDQYLSFPLFRTPLDDVVAPSHPLQARLGSHFELIGWDLEREIVTQGQEVLLTLYWRTLDPTDADYHVFVHVGDGQLIAQRDGIPRCGQRPTYRWEQGEEVVDRYLLWIDEESKSGIHPIRVGMYDIADGKQLLIYDAQGRSLGTSLLLTRLRVGEPRFEVPLIPHPQEATLGGKVRLLGYSLPSAEARPGESVSLTLYWQCLEEMDLSYTVFVHLVDGEGQICGQRDALPHDGQLPTDLWVSAEVVEDSHEVSIAPDAESGQYAFAIGMYDVGIGLRLAVFDEKGARLPDDRVLLRGVRVR